MILRKAFKRILALIALAAFLVWAYPFFENVGRFIELLRAPEPLAVPVPVRGVGSGRLENTWGAARSEGRRHEGIDIFAPRGTTVVSATQGFVTRRGWNRLGGRRINVLGPGGQSHYYAHLDAWDIPKVGDWVEPGTVLGYVGNSGNAQSTPPHLHYGIYSLSGQALNPYPLLAGDSGETGETGISGR